jgi:hypothetical protein
LGEWIDDNRERLLSEWDMPIGDAELLNHELGAFVHDPADPGLFDYDYDATPPDCFTFANTGVDGEHYSVLLGEDTVGVVVLTAPMAFGSEHLVVGESLLEAVAFVSGGCGLAVPPSFTYATWDGALAMVNEPRQSTLWDQLRSSLGLAPWPTPERRLRELQQQWLPHVQWRRPHT